MKVILISLLGAGSLLGQWPVEQKAVIAEILPKVEETVWLQIGWRTDLWEARREAAKSKKPIYLWEMDGHPLGCV
ncbi:hypothetical protein N9118_11635 [Akkermansiaceae bacterium]|jgi:hypothetical protein|nr:hypothetical protein [Akkermansiaceae bacterium]|tara:strand:- start:1071 stop:1295 length:225 start_codon:yes stop_codon:yes gene_type:complete